VKLGGVLDYKFELLRTIHTGIVAVAEWYNFRNPTRAAQDDWDQQVVDDEEGNRDDLCARLEPQRDGTSSA